MYYELSPISLPYYNTPIIIVLKEVFSADLTSIRANISLTLNKGALVQRGPEEGENLSCPVWALRMAHMLEQSMREGQTGGGAGEAYRACEAPLEVGFVLKAEGRRGKFSAEEWHD